MTEATITKLDTRQLAEIFFRNPLALYGRISNDMREGGLEDAPTLSRALEFASPSDKGEADAFRRLLRHAGIITQSDRQAGYYASVAEKFFKGEGNRALYTEFFAREWRKVTAAKPGQRAVLLSSDGQPGSWQRPYYDTTARQDQQVAPAIPLSELIAMSTPISGNLYRSLYLQYDAAQLRKFRVGESAEIPIATVTANEHTIQLQKFGRGVSATYEELRRMRVDRLAFFIRLAAVQAEVDKVAAALNILVNGDGNASTAATNYDINGDFGETAGALSLSGWMQFDMAFTQPYVMTHALMLKAIALELRLLNTGSANIPLAGLPLGGRAIDVTPINQTAGGVRYGWTTDAPANKIVGYDKRFAIEEVTEIGAEITEMQRFVKTQTQELVMSEISGFATLDANAVKTLDIST